MPTLKTRRKFKFQHEVLEVNKEFAEHYSESYQQGGFEAVSGAVRKRPLGTLIQSSRLLVRMYWLKNSLALLGT